VVLSSIRVESFVPFSVVSLAFLPSASLGLPSHEKNGKAINAKYANFFISTFLNNFNISAGNEATSFTLKKKLSGDKNAAIPATAITHIQCRANTTNIKSESYGGT
jgi:hypothetical protein